MAYWAITMGAFNFTEILRNLENPDARTAFIPLLTLGMPPNAMMALMVGAMWIGNLMLVMINLPMIGLWVRLCVIKLEFEAHRYCSASCWGGSWRKIRIRRWRFPRAAPGSLSSTDWPLSCWQLRCWL